MTSIVTLSVFCAVRNTIIPEIAATGEIQALSYTLTLLLYNTAYLADPAA